MSAGFDVSVISDCHNPNRGPRGLNGTVVE